MSYEHRRNPKFHTTKLLFHRLATYCMNIYGTLKLNFLGGPSRWWRSKTWKSPSSPEIHQKYIYMWNNSYRTPTECWQKTSDFPKDKKLPTYLAVWLTGSWYSSWVSGLSSEVGEPTSGHWTIRDLPAPHNINWRELSERS